MAEGPRGTIRQADGFLPAEHRHNGSYMFLDLITTYGRNRWIFRGAVLVNAQPLRNPLGCLRPL